MRIELLFDVAAPRILKMYATKEVAQATLLHYELKGYEVNHKRSLVTYDDERGRPVKVYIDYTHRDHDEDERWWHRYAGLELTSIELHTYHRVHTEAIGYLATRLRGRRYEYS